MVETTYVYPMQCNVVTSGYMIIDHIAAGVGVVMFCPKKGIAAGLHVMAPESPRLAPPNPACYANTAIAHALFQLEKMDTDVPSSIAIAGGASLVDTPEAANVGPKNTKAVQLALAKAKLNLKLNDTGGSNIRSIILNIDAGKIKIT